MRKLLGLLITLCLLQSCGESEPKTTTEVHPVDTVGLLVTRIQKCSKLYTSEYKVHKIITHDDHLRLKGSILGQSFNMAIPAGDRQIAIPIEATLKGYIDFGRFSIDNVIYDGDKIEIILPDPEVEMTSTKIDRDNVSEHVAIFRSDFTDKELAHYEQQGRETIINSIPELGITERARESASRILIPIITMLGIEEQNVVITFRKEFNSRQMHIISNPQIEKI